MQEKNSGSGDMPVTAYFQSSAHYWSSIYEESDVASIIFQDRRDLVVALVDQLHLEPLSRVLDVGCGAGHLAVTLAGKFMVEAVDTVQDMLETTRRRANAAKVQHRLNVRLADANQLNYESASFDLVTAIGVLPWVREITAPLKEFARVLRPGGYLIASIDNMLALNRLLDPMLHPMLQPLKDLVNTGLHRAGDIARKVHPTFSFSRVLDRSAANCGFKKMRGCGLGFGPFSFFGCDVLSGKGGIKTHRTLQRAADGGNRLLSSAGVHYVLTAKRLEHNPENQSKER
jgi:ubiquinone/menaquinone biosynthesis C-methylase UbiE